MIEIKGGVTAPKGFFASGIHCGLKREKKDLAFIYSDVMCSGAAVYTRNLVKGEPIYVTQEHLKDGQAQAIIINSGNANTCTGQKGRQNAFKMARGLAKEIGANKEDIIVASTGVIGVQLPVEKIEAAIPELVSRASKEGHIDASEAILTTDLSNKEIALSIEIEGKEVTLGGMAKGSGMIEPNMATMLSFITTDINIDQDLLKEALGTTVDKSYNRISVDGDTSTNDMVSILANGKAGNAKITSKDENYDKFVKALQHINIYLAKEIARDGEGATKLVECFVKGAKSEEDAEKLSKSVIASSLVKTAMFGADANWGRILCALGYAGVEVDLKQINIDIESKSGLITVYKDGKGADFDEDLAKKILDAKEIRIIVNLNSGSCEATAWGCDLSYDYVKINGAYRT
ncbi:MAG: bifunctional glutamate N-acetyltransferase/amino-acid acetyltransferase ArgJ [Epulopiscium sp.]|nr:bifunctional glutamate N-acetyltransferase/amino-acid acetyltransferase ArgJ [Candidatus Epulonipiscium sp.]